MPSAQHNHRNMQSREPARLRGIVTLLPELVGMVRGQLPASIEGNVYYSDASIPQEATRVVLEHIVEVLPTAETELS